MLKPHNHPVESHGRTALRNYIIQASTLLEITLSGLVLIGLLFSIVPLLKWMPGLLFDGNEAEIRTFLERSLDIVIGIEFIKMLAKHSPGSSLSLATAGWFFVYAYSFVSLSSPDFASECRRRNQSAGMPLWAGVRSGAG